MAEELRDIEPLRPLLDRKPFVILSDIDGTLAPIVSNPEDAKITVRARDALLALMGDGVGVGFISGRSLEEARELVDIPSAYVAANHGLSVYADGQVYTPPEVHPYVEWARKVVQDVLHLDVQGVGIENKGPIVAFHYRMANSQEEARAAILSAISASAAASHFLTREGRKVLELRPPLAIDKGTAVEALVKLMNPRSVLAMGDDVTDLDMFRGARNLSGVSAISVAVWSDEISPLMLENSDYFVRGVEGVEWLLEELLVALRTLAR